MAGHASAQEAPQDQGSQEKPFYIRQYKVKGASKMKRIDVEGAVYPFMGPACTTVQVDQARAALEKAYHDAGYSYVTVLIPAQDAKYGVVTLEVTESKIARLQVKGAKYFLPDKIRQQAPSLAEGEVPNFENIKKDILALNRHPGRQVTPDIRPGAMPGTLEVDLNVKDESPLHGSLELNNRYSPDTTELRVNGALSYSNLWQAGHTLGFNFQVAPERIEDAAVFSGYYVMPLTESTSLLLTATKQDSDINTLGGSSVGGKGYVLGGRLNFTLPNGPPFSDKPAYFHTLSAGVDFKHFDEDVTFGGQTQATPIEYYPFSLTYGGTWVAKRHSTDVNATLVYGLRGAGSDPYEFDNKRYLAGGNFLAARADLAHTHDLPGGMEIFAKIQGQIASQPLINSEQFSGGGLGNARGYLESTVLGDNALAGSLELRSPTLINRPKTASADKDKPADTPNTSSESKDEWRFYLFADAATLTLNDPLPGQTDQVSLFSLGAGTRLSLRDHFHASVDAGLPLRDAGVVNNGDWLVTFRLWTDF
ncbi:MAG: ShlB/FhaC/HecB family hemolysin secretion/activation protein [Verrucomicrobiaceae bacterium]|nr:MAG: ShlB/FhaC/HecB family hemolysin secretion/activation protein [Verrucomicrobiaceae bacterium]